ncbi:MAG: hypothetical protein M3004_02185 [Bacteroidota bacterium]|nr:hypothetical protein [Bacteroidota bacterium]
MKRLILFFLTGIAFSCNDQGTNKDAMKDSTATTTTSSATLNYPYKIDHPDNWDMGNSANTMTVLNAVKAFQDGNVVESAKYFGDSVHLQFDGLDKKVSHDSLVTWLTKMRNDYKSMDVKMSDWESVVSKDKKQEWVTLWYRQKWEDMKGNKDSADFVDDLQLKDSKIIRLDEYTRKLH